MEAAKIDWKNIESVFKVDQVFENINAPQWVDFLASPSSPRDDVAWFCRPECKHPASAEDFLNSKTPASSKLLRSVSVSKLIGLSDWRSANLKRRGPANQEDLQNQYLKAGIKSSADNDDYSQIMLHSHEKPRLTATHSAKDLFGGRDLFGKITDFCNELKKMAGTTRVNERGDDKEEEEDKTHSEKKMNERKPLLEVKFEAGEKNTGKAKLRKSKMRDDEAENVPISLDLNNIKSSAKISQTPIRTNPPTPQGFNKATPSKGPRSRLKERAIFQELREELDEKRESLVAAKEGRALDVFWFLKPCTLAS